MSKVKDFYHDEMVEGKADTINFQPTKDLSDSLRIRPTIKKTPHSPYKSKNISLYDIVGISKITRLGVFIKKHPVLYYILNLTWGLPLTLVGFLVTILLFPFTKRYKYKYIYYIELPMKSSWGLSIGMTFISGKGSSAKLRSHEFGHTVQNAMFGPFMLLLVSIPSVTRYWIRELKRYFNPDVKLEPYESVWYEKTATNIGDYGKAWYDHIEAVLRNAEEAKDFESYSLRYEGRIVNRR